MSPAHVARAAAELHQLYRWRRVLVPLTCAAVVLNGLVYWRVIVDSELWGTSLLTTATSFVFAIWAARVQYRIVHTMRVHGKLKDAWAFCQCSGCGAQYRARSSTRKREAVVPSEWAKWVRR